MAVSLDVTDYSELKGAILDQDGSIVGFVSSVPDLVNVMNEYEKRSGTTFNVVYSRSSFGQTEIKSSKKHSVQWDTAENPKGPSIAFCGIPFLVLDTLRLECHFGRDRSRARKDRRLKLAEEATNGEASSQPKRSRTIPASVKMSCPATIICVEVVYFPEFEIDEDSKSRRTAASRLLRNALAEDISIRTIDRRIYIRLPASNSHSDHPRGEMAAATLQLDKRIAAFIRDQVVRGESDITVVEKLVRQFVSQEIPEAWSAGPNNRKYFPKRKIITEHMYRERQRLQSLKVDQDQLLCEMENWTTDGDSVYFRPAGAGGNGDRRLLLVHQTKWQQRLLSLYGNDVCILDAVFRAIKYAVPMFFIVVRTNVNYAVVATLLVHNDDSSSIAEALDVLKSWNILWKPSFFFVDCYKAERKAVTKCFPETAIFLGDFHRDQAWKRWLNSACCDVRDHQHELLEAMIQIAASVTPSAYEDSVKSLQSSDVWIASQSLQDWFSQEWLSQYEHWVWCFRPGILNMRMRNTENIDNEQRSLRHRCLVGLTDRSLDFVLASVRQFLLSNCKRYITLNVNACELMKTYSENLPVYLQNRTPDLVNHCQERLASIWDVSDIQLIGADNYAVYSAASGATYLVNFISGNDLPSCHCLDWAQTLWPCKHILAVLETYNCWNVMPERYLSSSVFSVDSNCVDQSELTVDILTGNQVTDDSDTEIDFEQASLMAIANAFPIAVAQPVDDLAGRCRELLRSINDFTFVALPPAVAETLHNGLAQLLDGLRENVSKEKHPDLVSDVKTKPTMLPGVNSIQRSAPLQTSLNRKGFDQKRRVHKLQSNRRRKIRRTVSLHKRIKVENNDCAYTDLSGSSATS